MCYLGFSSKLHLKALQGLISEPYHLGMKAQSVDLKTYLETQLGRDLTLEELANAIGGSKSTIKRRNSEGFLIHEVLEILDHFHLSRTSGLLALGIIELDDAMDALGEDGALVDDTSTHVLAEVVAQRLREAAGIEPSRKGFVTLVEDRTNTPTKQTARMSGATKKRTRLRKGLLE